jgi:hypothetical protein
MPGRTLTESWCAYVCKQVPCLLILQVGVVKKKIQAHS